MVEMKESGIEWIGEIPMNWNCKKLKYILASPLMYGANESGEEYNEQYPRYIRITDIDDNNALKEDGKLSLSPIIAKPYILQDNDILFARSGASVGKTFLYKRIYGKAAFAGYLIKAQIDTSIVVPKYVYYSTLSTGYDNWKNSIFTQATIQNIGADKYSIYQVPVPPISEQFEIVSFLDEKCAEIDALSADIQAEIDTLEEYKHTVITEKVTKGLNPDVAMKDSGIEWVGKCPAHWQIMANKYVMKKVKNIKAMYENEDILSLTMKGVIVRDLEAGGKMPTSFDGYQILYPDNLLMCLFDYDVTPRCIGLIKNYGLSSPAYSQFEMKNQNYEGYYYYYYLMTDNAKALLHLAKNLRHSFTEEQLGYIHAPVPPQKEQQEIAKYLDTKCTEIDSIIETKKEQLKVLDEYKKSIIYEYVTGKKEVV